MEPSYNVPNFKPARQITVVEIEPEAKNVANRNYSSPQKLPVVNVSLEPPKNNGVPGETPGSTGTPLDKTPIYAQTTDTDIKYFYARDFQAPVAYTPALANLAQCPGHAPMVTVFRTKSKRPERVPKHSGASEDRGGKASFESSKEPESQAGNRFRSIGEYKFPYKTYQPKVQLPFKGHEADQVPQAVAAERLHRIYMKTDMQVSLTNVEVTSADLVPIPLFHEPMELFFNELQRALTSKIDGLDKFKLLRALTSKASKKESENIASDPCSGDSEEVSQVAQDIAKLIKSDLDPFLPLDLFDNEDFDVHPGNEWIQLGHVEKEDQHYPIPGKAFLPSSEVQSASYSGSKTSNSLQGNYLSMSPNFEKFNDQLMHLRYGKLTTKPTKSKKSKKTNMEDTEESITNLASMESALADDSEITVPSLEPLAASPSFKQAVDSFRSIRSRLSRNSAAIHKDSRNNSGAGGDSLDLSNHASALYVNISDKSTGTEVDANGSRTSFSDLMKPKIQAAGENVHLNIVEAAKSRSLLSEVFSTSTTDSLAFELRNAKSQNDLEEDLKYIDQNHQEGEMTEADLDLRESELFLEDDADNSVLDFNKIKNVNVKWNWVPVAVFQYDSDTRRYLVRSISTPTQSAWLSKIYLCFDAEDPQHHAARIKDAVERRLEAENRIRYQLILSCLSLDSNSLMAIQHLKQILVLLLDTPNFKSDDHELKKLQREIDLTYRRTMTELEFQHVVLRNPCIYYPWIEVPLPERPWQSSVSVDLPSSDVIIRTASFKAKRVHVQKQSVILKPEVLECLVQVMSYCLEMEQTKFLEPNQGLPSTLIEYFKLQRKHMNSTIEEMNEFWIAEIVKTVRAHISEIPHSWYNVDENRWDIYAMSKMSGFLTVVKFMMRNTVRNMVTSAISSFVTELEAQTQLCQVEEEDFVWTTGLAESPFEPPSKSEPVFKLELVFDFTGPRYTDSLEAYPQVLSELYSLIFQNVSKLPDVAPLVMNKLLFGTVRNLHPVHETEPEFKDLEARMLSAVQRALVIVAAYSQMYSQYMPLWQLDIDKYLKETLSEVQTGPEIAKIVQKHVLEQESLEDDLPLKIDIGCFRVSVEGLKETLASKKKDIINGLLNEYAWRLRTSVKEIFDQYISIDKQLRNRSDDIEQIVHLKTFVQVVPQTVFKLMQKMNKLSKEYELFDKFCYALSPQDFDLRWNTALMPRRLLKLALMTESWLEEDVERLGKLQQDEMVMLSDAVDAATLAVAGLVAYHELEKALEIVQEVKKVYKILQELHEKHKLLSYRQTLFDLPAYKNEALEKLQNEFEPFQVLWYTAADWRRVYEAIFLGTLDKIEVTTAEKLVNSGLAEIRACSEHFKGSHTMEHVANQVEHEIQVIEQVLPIVKTLKNPGMRVRHWEALSAICGFTIVAKAKQPFQELLDQGIQAHREQIEELNLRVTKEFQVETKLEQLNRKVDILRIKLYQNPELGIDTIKVPPKILKTIDEVTADLTILQQNEYKDAFADKIDSTQKQMVQTQESLKKWAEFQEKWVLVIPHFREDRAQMAMPNEFKLFQKMERIWRRLNRIARDKKEVCELGSDATVRSSLKQFAAHFEKLETGLEEHLKRRQGSSSDDDELNDGAGE